MMTGEITMHNIFETDTLCVITLCFTGTFSCPVLQLLDVAADRSVVSIFGTSSMQINSCSHILNRGLEYSCLILPLLDSNRENSS